MIKRMVVSMKTDRGIFFLNSKDYVIVNLGARYQSLRINESINRFYRLESDQLYALCL